jgi:steroid delta-isomerase-like uncharacterized protein
MSKHPAAPAARTLAALGAILVLACTEARAGSSDNVRIAKRVFLENMAQGRFDTLHEIYGPHFVAHGASADYGLERDSAATASWREAMPDLKVTIERTVADSDLVAVHWKVVGTNTVAAGGMPGKGDRVGIEGMTFFRFAAGLIVEEWSVIDVATLRKQLD